MYTTSTRADLLSHDLKVLERYIFEEDYLYVGIISERIIMHIVILSNYTRIAKGNSRSFLG